MTIAREPGSFDTLMMRGTIGMRAAALCAATALTAAALAPATVGAVARAKPFDFNGDGLQDLTVSAIGDQNDGPLINDGAVHVFYSDAPEVDEPTDQFFDVTSHGLGPFPGYPGLFGWAIASGDFNRDGYADLALTIPGDDRVYPMHEDGLWKAQDSGSVQVIYGSEKGLRPNLNERARLWTQDSSGVSGAAEEEEALGQSLTSGDFDGDGYDDLAVGSPYEGIATSGTYHGAVILLFGGIDGIAADGDEFWHQNRSGVLDFSEHSDVFGAPLRAGDFNGDGVDDLAAGVRREDIGGGRNAGAVNVLYGDRGRGLTPASDDFVWQGLEAVPGNSEAGDSFGSELVVGNFNGDGFDDLVIGTPNETLPSGVRTGEALVLYGGVDGLRPTRNDVLRLAKVDPSVYDLTNAGFSSGMAAGDLDRDGHDELVISGARALYVLHGRPEGLLGTTFERLESNPKPLAEYVGIGKNIALAELDDDPGLDLVLGHPGAVLTGPGGRSIGSAGAVEIIASRNGSFVDAERRFMHQGSAGVASDPKKYEGFGSAVLDAGGIDVEF